MPEGEKEEIFYHENTKKPIVIFGLSQIFHETDRSGRKAFQSEAVVIYCED